MPLFEVEQYELHSSKYEVEAGSMAEAIQKVFGGDGILVEGSTEYIEVDDSRGIRLSEYLELAIELTHLGVIDPYRNQIVPSIRTVRLIKTEPSSSTEGENA